ncbi:heavy metal-binding domain-containing protein [Methanobrevibacter sp. DSM 116169]|uniref:heavy metal-binding domain-containing protein n=1 Tax=Methanobrevibacter sp. DSM 116169 TaxID=3242727 RepID=UPI0038FC3A24
MVSIEEFPISTTNDIPGFEIVECRGFAYGLTVRSRGAGGQITAGVRSLFGGEIKEYVQVMEESRNDALERLIAHAKDLGANGLVGVRYDSDNISDIMQEILAYGTAVVVKEK